MQILNKMGSVSHTMTGLLGQVRKMMLPWLILMVVCFASIVFMGNIYHRSDILYHDNTDFDSTNHSRNMAPHRRQGWPYSKVIRSQPCPLKYFAKNAILLDVRKAMLDGDEYSYQTHLATELLHSNSSLISLTKLNIPKVFNSTFLNPCWYESLGPDKRKLHCLPYYFLAGFPKCGTTDLYFKMALHPQIRLATWKEPHWWTRTRLPNINISFEKYEQGFDRAANCIEKVAKLNLLRQVRLVTGDASASTLWDNRYWRQFPGNRMSSEPRLIMADIIRHYLPASRIIVIVRDPVYRLFSDYTYFWNNNKVLPSAEDFHNKVKYSINAVTECLKNNTVRTCVYGDMIKTKVRIHVGMYSVYLRDWYRVFPRQQIHVLRTEDYATSPEKELKKIFSFLKLEPLEESWYRKIRDMSRMNEQKRLKMTMLPKTEMMLRNFYMKFNTELATLLNNSDYLWLPNSL